MHTWNVPGDISESKHFSIAIYNMAMLGGIGYFLGNYLGESNIAVGTLLRVLGISTSSAIAVSVVMVPKLILSRGFLDSLDRIGLKSLVKEQFKYTSSASHATSSASHRNGPSSSDSSREKSSSNAGVSMDLFHDAKISPEIDGSHVLPFQ